MNKTAIEYLTHTWNPIKMRCTPVSVGCANCWHLRMATRQAANKTLPLPSQLAAGGGAPYLDLEELEAPLLLRKPARIGVQFMGDLFHDSMLFTSQAAIWERMTIASQHIYFILTKRTENLRRRMGSLSAAFGSSENIWLGVSVEDRITFQDRVSMLKATPAAFRWVSVEPLLADPGPELDLTGIDWVVCGAETGPHKRPCNPFWITNLRDQCATAGVPFFGKVWQDGKPISPREIPT